MIRSNRSKTMQNFNRAADRTLTKVGNVTSKGGQKIAKWAVTDHTGAADRSNLMVLSQSFNFGMAKLGLIGRRMQRDLDSFNKFARTGVKTTFMEHVVAWIVDYLLFLWDLIWGFIKPILIHILFTIFSIILILLLNAIFFYALYLLITS